MIGTCGGNWCFAWSRSVRKFLFCCRCGVSLTNSELDRVWVRLNVSNDGMYSYKSLIKAFAHKQTGQDVRREQTDSESRPALGPSTSGCYYMVDLFLPLWLANIQQCRKIKCYIHLHVTLEINITFDFLYIGLKIDRPVKYGISQFVWPWLQTKNFLSWHSIWLVCIKASLHHE